MSLLELQAAMARLYTDDAFRRAFFQDRVGACSTIDLTLDERRRLAGIREEQVELYVRSLKRKRGERR